MATTGASLQPIYDRLHAIEPYHPMSANTFADWSIEAGDIITMSRDGNTSSSPVHSAHLSWRGSPMITLNSEGKEKRDSVAKTSKRKYGGSGAGMRNNQALYYEMFSEDGRLHSELMYSESVLRVEFTNADNALRSEFEVTASHLRTEFQEADGRLESEFEITASNMRAEYIDNEERLKSEFELTASQLRTDFEDADAHLESELLLTASIFQTELVNTASGLSSRITQTANKVAIVVDGNNNIKAAQIVAAINADGSSQAIISADHVYLDGTTRINQVFTVVSSAVGVSVPMICSGNINIEDGKTLNTYSVTLQGGNPITLTALGMADVIASASVSENVLTLTPFVGDPITFSKATTLSGEWSGNTYTVTATPQGNHVSDTIFMYTDGNASTNFTVGASHTASDKTKSVASQYIYLVANGTGINAKINACTNSNGTGIVGSYPVSDLYEEVTRYKGDGGRLSYVTRYLGNGTRLATGTRYTGDGTRLGSSGTYYKGNGTRLASVTRYLGNGTRLGSNGTYYKGNGTQLGASGTYYKGNGTRLAYVTRYLGNGTRLGSNGTYYKGNGTRLGSSGTYYKGNGTRLASVTRYLGNGTSVTGRGSSISRKYYGTLYDMSSGTPASKGTGSWFLIENTQVANVYRGNGSAVTGMGDAVTVYAEDATGSYYLRGDSVTAYPTDSSGSNYLRGDSVTAYPTDSSGSNYLRGDSASVYAQDNTGGYYLRGDSVTAYPTDSSGSNYLRGTSQSVYIADNSGNYYLRGDAINAYVSEASGTYHLRGTSEQVLIDKTT